MLKQNSAGIRALVLIWSTGNMDKYTHTLLMCACVCGEISHESFVSHPVGMGWMEEPNESS